MLFHSLEPSTIATSKLSPLHSVSDGRACQECMNPALGWCHVAAGTFALRLARSSTNAPYNMLTHSKSGYGFGSVYISDTYTFLIHIRFCSLCILLRRKVLACSTYLLASMTDHLCRDLLFMYMRCVPHNHPYWLCLSPHPKPSRHRCGQSTVLAKYRN